MRVGSEVDFFCQAESGIRDLERSRGMGGVYKSQAADLVAAAAAAGSRDDVTAVLVRVDGGGAIG